MQTYANQLLEEEYVVDTIQIQTSRVEQNVGEGEDKDLCPADMGIPIGMPNLNLKLLTELLNYQVDPIFCIMIILFIIIFSIFGYIFYLFLISNSSLFRFIHSSKMKKSLNLSKYGILRVQNWFLFVNLRIRIIFEGKFQWKIEKNWLLLPPSSYPISGYTTPAFHRQLHSLWQLPDWDSL